MAALAVQSGLAPADFWAMRLRDFLRITDHLKRRADEQRLEAVKTRAAAKARSR